MRRHFLHESSITACVGRAGVQGEIWPHGVEISGDIVLAVTRTQIVVVTRDSTNDTESIRVERWAWLQVVASDKGPGSPTTRHILHAISLHMNAAGDNAWPSMDTIAIRTGGSVRAAKEHVRLAKENGWLKVGKKRLSGQRWQVNEYSATVPKFLKEFIPKSIKQSARDAPRRPQQSARRSRTKCTSVPDAVQEVHPNSSVNYPYNGSPPTAPDGAGVCRDARKFPPAGFRTKADQAMIDSLDRKNNQEGPS